MLWVSELFPTLVRLVSDLSESKINRLDAGREPDKEEARNIYYNLSQA